MSHERWIQKLSPAVQSIYNSESPNSSSRLLLEFSGRQSDKIVDIVRANQGKIVHSINLIPLLAAEVPLGMLPKVANSLYIRKIWNDPPVSLMEGQTFSGKNTDESIIEDIQEHQSTSHPKAPVIPEYDYTGKGIVAAVLDTGIYPHQDLMTPNSRIIGWQDFVNHKTFPYDDHGHGTETAGIIGGNGSSSEAVNKGMAPEAWLVGVKILDQDGNGRLSNIIAGIEWCIRNLPLFNIRIIYLSIPALYQDRFHADPFARILSMAWRKGIAVFAPVPKQKNVNFHGLPQPLISVASLNQQQAFALDKNHFMNSDSAWDNLNIPSQPDLVVEAEQVVSLNMEDGYTRCSGNTIAAAMAAGGAALVLEKRPSFGPAQIKYFLTKRAKNLGLGKSLQGSGLLNLDILGNPKKKISLTRSGSSFPLNMSQMLPMALKMCLQNSGRSGDYPNEFFMNLLGTLIRNWTHSSDSIN